MEEYQGLKELLRKNLEVSEETLKLVRRMNRARVMGGIFKAVKWLIIIAITLGLYYYIEPYVRGLLDTLSALNANLSEIKATSDNFNSNLLDKIQNLLP